MARDELARFLRDRREQLHAPTTVTSPQRRTPGLRREEVADLANMSLDYYVRLEQARGPRPSPQILDALAGALRLEPAERIHLFTLAGQNLPSPENPPREVTPHVTDLLRRLPLTAALVTSAAYDVLAFNPLAQALFSDLDTRPNLARRRFLDRDQVLTDGHEDFAEIAVSRLRASADRYPRSQHLHDLLTQLTAGSPEFRALWTGNQVRLPGHRTKSMLHPELGPLRVNCDVIPIADADQQIVFITPDPDTPTAHILSQLTRVEVP
ncbi:transcriptional regulator with XRE-family HTH domain [Catenulispora sp. GAS73]|uniref:helix-turn-helix transcriptional regulator n=1 Tax=Catenulispora sp. GAS73 TaxID=3156269 RepID=UPI0035170248